MMKLLFLCLAGASALSCTPRKTSEGGFPPLEESEQKSSGLKVPGSLVIAGGSLVQNSTVFARFLKLAGGAKDAKIVYIPTNSGGSCTCALPLAVHLVVFLTAPFFPPDETPAQQERELNKFLETACWTDLPNEPVLLHTYNATRADEVDFVAPLDEATGVFFAGGLPYRAYDAYFGTETQAALERVLQRGGVVGGSSAGALMQSNVMLRGDRSNDNSIMLGDVNEGFAFGGMENIAVDVHWLMRNRASDIVEVIEERPEILGFSIDENTALVMQGDVVEVIGAGWVGVYDTSLWASRLRALSRYNQRFRKPRSIVSSMFTDFRSNASRSLTQQEENYCANFNLYAPRVARPLVPSQGKVFMLGGDIRGNGRHDRYDVRRREVILSKDLEDWSAEDAFV